MLAGVQTYSTHFDNLMPMAYYITADLYAECATKNDICKDFHFAIYPELRLLYSDGNQSRVLMFRDKLARDWFV